MSGLWIERKNLGCDALFAAIAFNLNHAELRGVNKIERSKLHALDAPNISYCKAI